MIQYRGFEGIKPEEPTLRLVLFSSFIFSNLLKINFISLLNYHINIFDTAPIAITEIDITITDVAKAITGVDITITGVDIVITDVDKAKTDVDITITDVAKAITEMDIAITDVARAITETDIVITEMD